MQIHSTISSLRDALMSAVRAGQRVAFVPTMGNLHAGHISLVEEAHRRADCIVASIFVNPMQFGKNEDLDAYPRTPSEDIERLKEAGCHMLFMPAPREIYPNGLAEQTVVSVPALTTMHCGASRPGHFDGVATVVSKLFNIVRPDTAIFGLKDYQQYLVIRKMTADLCIPTEIIGCETLREPDGLAMSSRNGYLDTEQRQTAPVLYRVLQSVREHIEAGKPDYRGMEHEARTRLLEAGLRPDYFSICHAGTLALAIEGDRDLVILAAAYLGPTRLIDNIRFSLAER